MKFQLLVLTSCILFAGFVAGRPQVPAVSKGAKGVAPSNIHSEFPVDYISQVYPGIFNGGYPSGVISYVFPGSYGSGSHGSGSYGSGYGFPAGVFSHGFPAGVFSHGFPFDYYGAISKGTPFSSHVGKTVKNVPEIAPEAINSVGHSGAPGAVSGGVPHVG